MNGTNLNTTLTSTSVSQAQIDTLLYMIEEEKMARDVYDALYEQTGILKFDTISNSEQKHYDTLLSAAASLGIDVSALSTEVGVFTNAEVQALYDQLLAQGSLSLEAALETGIAIEQTDITDLQNAIDESDVSLLDTVYSNLMRASYNHLDAFESSGNDIYYVNNTSDVIVEVSGGGTDTVNASVNYSLMANIENLTLTGTGNINGAGNGLNNTLIGNSGNNVLNGGIGADVMQGGEGNDTYYVDNRNDSVVENSGGGVDKVMATVSYTLGSYVENLTLIGTSSINGIGNALNNTLIGNAASNVLAGQAGNDILSGLSGNDALYGGMGRDKLFGGLGNDVLNGGLGNDTLSGGAGKDIFVFNSALNSLTNKDTILDFNVADDTIRLENAVFTSLTTTGVLNSDYFKDLANGVQDSDDYIVYNSTTGILSYDADGNGAGAAVQIALIGISDHAVLTNADFVVV